MSHGLRAQFSEKACDLILALLEADLATEGVENYLGAGLADGAEEGSSLLGGVAAMLGNEVEVVVDFAEDGMDREVGGGVGGNDGFNIAAVGGEFIVAAGTEVAVVKNLAAAGVGAHEGAVDGSHGDAAADGRDLDMAVFNVAYGNWSAHGGDMEVPVADVVDIDDGVGAFEGQITLKILGRQGAGGGAQAEGGVGGDLEFVVDAAGLSVGAGEEVRGDFDAVAALFVIDFGLIGLRNGPDDHLTAVAGLYGNSAVLGIHGDIGPGSDIEAHFLVGLGDRDRHQTGRQQQGNNRGLLQPLHDKSPFGRIPGLLKSY